MTIKQQKAPVKKITVQSAKPAKPAGEGMGMRNPVGNLGKYAHPPKRKG